MLDPRLNWELHKVNRSGRNGSRWDEYHLECPDDPMQKSWIFSRVSKVLEKAYGAGENLVKYNVKQALLDVLTRFLVDNEDGLDLRDMHLSKLNKVNQLLDTMAYENARKSESGHIVLDRKWNFQRLCGRLSQHFSFGYPDNLGFQVLSNWMDDAAENGRFRKMERAAELGTRAHELIEFWLSNGCTFEYADPETGEDRAINLDLEEPAVQNAVSAFFDFWDKHGMNVRFLEKRVFDLKLGYAGTGDGFFTDQDGDLVYLDWKTSAGVYASRKSQCAAYGLAAARMGPDYGLGWPKRAYIIRFDKVTAQFEIYCIWDNKVQFLKHVDQWIRCLLTYDYLSSEERDLEKIRGSL